jgi:L-ascorbate metabolism protein UlaG (beta-lactamase superfamily)
MASEKKFELDTIETSVGPLVITFLGHGTLMMAFDKKIIHVDPYSSVADYSILPKADLVLVTHEHMDHLDLKALSNIRTEKTEIITNEAGAKKLGGGSVMHAGDVLTVGQIKIEAVLAYNILHKRDNGEPFHPKGVGNGYILTFGDTRLYIAGDTENTPEMKALQDIDVAFLPMNLPYTMTPEMVADAATTFKPKILYPYHFGNTNTSELVDLLEGEDIEVRIRQMA